MWIKANTLKKVIRSCLLYSHARRFLFRANEHIDVRAIYYEFKPDREIIPISYRRADSPLNKAFYRDTSINSFFESDYGRELRRATNEAVADPKDILLEGATAGVTICKFKYHISIGIVIRWPNIPP